MQRGPLCELGPASTAETRGGGVCHLHLTSGKGVCVRVALREINQPDLRVREYPKCCSRRLVIFFLSRACAVVGTAG